MICPTHDLRYRQVGGYCYIRPEGHTLSEDLDLS